MYEGGVRLPYIVRWPGGGVPAGRVDGAAVLSNVDWMPTILRLAGVERLPASDGVDVLPLWRGRIAAKKRAKEKANAASTPY